MVQGLNNISASRWVIGDSNGTIKMASSRNLSNTSIIFVECIALKDGVVTTNYNCFMNLEIEMDFKVMIDYYNRKSSALIQLII